MEFVEEALEPYLEQSQILGIQVVFLKNEHQDKTNIKPKHCYNRTFMNNELSDYNLQEVKSLLSSMKQEAKAFTSP